MDELTRRLAEISAQANLRADWEKTLALLAALKAGSVTLANVELTGGGWNLIPNAIVAEVQPDAAG